VGDGVSDWVFICRGKMPAGMRKHELRMLLFEYGVYEIDGNRAGIRYRKRND
jgi:hypothetical protein